MSHESASRLRLDDRAIRAFVIEAAGGDREIVQFLVQSYLESAGELAANLPVALEKQDWTSLRRSAHSLKSSSKMFGLRSIARNCAEVEDRANGGNREGLDSLVEEIMKEMAEAQRILPEYCDRLVQQGKS